MTDEKKLRERVYETVTAALGRGYADAADQIADAVCDLVSAEAAPQRTSEARLCGKYLGDNDGTCPQLTCIRDHGHPDDCDNVRGDGEPCASEASTDDLALPFCACGRRWSECDGSRKACAKRARPGAIEVQRPNEAGPFARLVALYEAEHDPWQRPAWVVAALESERAQRTEPAQRASKARPTCGWCGETNPERIVPSSSETGYWCVARHDGPRMGAMLASNAQEVEAEFIEAFAHFIRQAWAGLSRGEADARRSGCISRFTTVKRKFSALRQASGAPEARIRDLEAALREAEEIATKGDDPAYQMGVLVRRVLGPETDQKSWQEKQAEGSLEDDRPGCPHREDAACAGCRLSVLMKGGKPLRVRILRNDLWPSMEAGTLATVTGVSADLGTVDVDVDGWGKGFCTSTENVEPVEPESAVVTAEVCGDVRVGRVVVRCECGSYREAERPHGFREAEQERAAAAAAAVKELEEAAIEYESAGDRGTGTEYAEAEKRLEKARAAALEYAAKPLYVVSTSTRVGDR